jgi:hypothetical protein
MTRCNPYRLVGGAVFMGVIFSLSACGGSSSSGFVSGPPVTTPPPPASPPPVPPPDITSFNMQVATGREDFAAFETTPGLPSAKMPVTGRGYYSGVVLYKTASLVSGLPYSGIADTILESPSMSSDIWLQANFEPGTIEGILGNFNDSTTGNLSGGLFIRNGTIFEGNSGESEFKGDLTGNFYKDGTPRNPTGAINGVFGGSVTPDVAGGVLSLDLGAGDQFIGIYSAD